MSVTNQQEKGMQGRVWECKQCHELIDAEETVAFHLVDKILYGWCQPCFNHRGQSVLIGSEIAA
jgi:hypothetical protein